MLLSFFRKLRERRAATAMMFAVLIVPMVIAAGAAVDLANLTLTRAQLQAAVTGAAEAGVGSYANEINGSNALAVANSSFNASYAGIAGAAPLVGSVSEMVGCTGGTTALCGPSTPTSTTNGTIQQIGGACGAGYTWCSTVTATVTRKNPFFFSFPLIGGLPVNGTITASATKNWAAQSNNVTPANPTKFANFAQLYYVAGTNGNGGTVNVGHGAGVGTGTPIATNNNQGYDPVVIFLDANNSTAPAMSYNSVVPPSLSSTCTTTGAGATTLGTSGLLDDIPTGSYCNGLTLGTGQSAVWNFIDSSSSTKTLNIVNGDLTIAPQTVICPEVLPLGYSYSGAGVTISDPCNPSYNTYKNTPVYIGQSSNSSTSGSLILNYEVDITPSTGNSGVLYFVADEIFTFQQSSGSNNLGAAVCSGAATTCTTAASTASTVTYSGAGSGTFHSTYITTITVQNGLDVSWTAQKVFASTFTSTNGQTSSNTQVAEAGGKFTGSTTTTAGTPSITETAETINTNQNSQTTAFNYKPSDYATGTDTSVSPSVHYGDTYGYLDHKCTQISSANPTATTYSIGGTSAIDSPNNPYLSGLTVDSSTKQAAISISGAPGDLFALTTNAPTSVNPPVAYNFTNPNYGYSFITSTNSEGILLVESGYFCGTGTGLSVSNGNATAITVTTTKTSGSD
jgi:Flp pilus assembly protein TadG